MSQMPKITKVELLNSEGVKSAGIGWRLKDQRRRQGLSLRELALLAHVSHSAIVQWETSRVQPSFAMIEKLAELLQTTPEYLAFGICRQLCRDERYRSPCDIQ